MKWLYIIMSSKLRYSILVNLATIPNRMKVIPCPYIISNRTMSNYKSERNITEYYNILNLDEGCSAAEVRESFHQLAKQFHPDSGSNTADSAAFIQIEEAYRMVLDHVMDKKKRQIEVEEEADEDMHKYKTPQHRHYLSFEGFGLGTPSQREKQYRQFRADRASEQAMEYQKRKLENQYYANSVTAKNVRQSKNQKITQAIERLVEDLIQESMAKGDFDNLSGKGKPLNKFSGCSYIDPMTHNLNRILIDNGYQPEWILMQKEIKDTIVQLRRDILVSRNKLGHPMTSSELTQWSQDCEKFQENIKKLNKRINYFNLIVPILNRQKVHFDAEKEIARVLKNYENLIEAGKMDNKNTINIETKNVKVVGFKEGFFKWLNLSKYKI
ncbi:dnaJ homolog subfamily C member 28 [Phascolarctos cinereus]|uniref:DnaJ homolog subfamily C member 28 n=1 Tax=Phascolarctos cinereus TaxID=38626 RepID=A0A6P5L476_PHACI|nr:dnaJ homolog subfamily C member 28 [Phascolarctos cinereus]